MSKINDLPTQVPETTSIFSIDVEGKLTKRRYIGEFECKISNLKIQSLIDRHKAFLNGPDADQLNPYILKLNHMVAYLRFTITKSPSWWSSADLGYELMDENVVEEVYNQVMDFEKQWFESIWGKESESEG